MQNNEMSVLQFVVRRRQGLSNRIFLKSARNFQQTETVNRLRHPNRYHH